MAQADLAQAVQRVGNALHHTAIRAKRTENASRRTAREARQALAELRETCARHGIQLVIADGGPDE